MSVHPQAGTVLAAAALIMVVLAAAAGVTERREGPRSGAWGELIPLGLIVALFMLPLLLAH